MANKGILWAFFAQPEREPSNLDSKTTSFNHGTLVLNAHCRRTWDEIESNRYAAEIANMVQRLIKAHCSQVADLEVYMVGDWNMSYNSPLHLDILKQTGMCGLSDAIAKASTDSFELPSSACIDHLSGARFINGQLAPSATMKAEWTGQSITEVRPPNAPCPAPDTSACWLHWYGFDLLSDHKAIFHQRAHLSDARA